MIKFLAVDCEEGPNTKHCKNINIADTPHIMIYPPLPMSPFKYAGAPEQEPLLKTVYKNIPGDKVKTLKTMDDYKEFTKKNPTKPKCILYSDKKKAPVILKGLSAELVYSRTIEFGFVGSEAPEVLADSGAGKKKLPAVVMIKPSTGKKEWFKGKEMNF